MEPERLYGIIFLLMLIQFTLQVDSANGKMDIKKSTTLRKLLKQNFSIPDTGSNDQSLELLHPLCYEDKEPAKVTPCNSTNKSNACFDWLTGNFRGCIDTNKGINFIPLLPACVVTKLYQRFVVSCSKNYINFCFSFNSKYKIIEFCSSNSQTRTCLGAENTLVPCSERRFKRQQPEVPQLDSDAYYASCENCTIRVIMTVDENSNERPTIEIKSEPIDENEEIRPKKKN